MPESARESAKVEVGKNGEMPLLLWLFLANDCLSLDTARMSDS
jgi:hypothetical protein